MGKNYFKERDKKNMSVVTELSTSLPQAVTEYMNAISLSRAPSTLANYSRQLNVFFVWITDNDIIPKKPKEINFDDLESINSDDVISFMHALRFTGDKCSKFLSAFGTSVWRRLCSDAAFIFAMEHIFPTPIIA